MADYQKIEYRIDKDGNILETVLNASGSSCTLTTAPIEALLGKVESRELLPDYYESDETQLTDEIQTLTQH